MIFAVVVVVVVTAVVVIVVVVVAAAAAAVVVVVGIAIVGKLTCKLSAWISRSQTRENLVMDRLKLLHIWTLVLAQQQQMFSN